MFADALNPYSRCVFGGVIMVIDGDKFSFVAEFAQMDRKAYMFPIAIWMCGPARSIDNSCCVIWMSIEFV